jgi:hypothetical protein
MANVRFCRAAYHAGDLDALMQASLYLCCALAARSPADRAAMQTRFEALIGAQAIVPDPAEGTELPSALASIDLPKLAPLMVDMDVLRDAVDCKVRFAQRTVFASDPIVVLVALRSRLAAPVEIGDIRVLFGLPAYDQADFQVTECGHADASARHTLQPGTTHVFLLRCHPTASEDHQLRCQHVSVRLGQAQATVLRWSVGEQQVPELLPPELAEGAIIPDPQVLARSAWSQLPNFPVVRVQPVLSSVAIEAVHASPALVGEQFPVCFKITSEEKLPMQQVRVTVSVRNVEPPGAARLRLPDGSWGGQYEQTIDGMEVGGGRVDGVMVVMVGSGADALLARKWQPGASFEHSATLAFSLACRFQVLVRVEYSAPLSATSSTIGLHTKVRGAAKGGRPVDNVLLGLTTGCRGTSLTWKPRTLLTWPSHSRRCIASRWLPTPVLCSLMSRFSCSLRFEPASLHGLLFLGCVRA